MAVTVIDDFQVVQVYHGQAEYGPADRHFLFQLPDLLVIGRLVSDTGQGVLRGKLAHGMGVLLCRHELIHRGFQAVHHFVYCDRNIADFVISVYFCAVVQIAVGNHFNILPE